MIRGAVRRLLHRIRCFLRGDHNHETTTVTICVDCGTVRRYGPWLHANDEGYPTREELGR